MRGPNPDTQPRSWSSPEEKLWSKVVELAIADARHNPVARAWCEAPPWWIVHGACGLDPGYWLTRVLPELRQDWAEIDARRDAHGDWPGYRLTCIVCGQNFTSVRRTTRACSQKCRGQARPPRVRTTATEKGAEAAA